MDKQLEKKSQNFVLIYGHWSRTLICSKVEKFNTTHNTGMVDEVD